MSNLHSYRHKCCRFDKFHLEKDHLAYATHGILEPHREHADFDNNQLKDLTYLCGTTFPDL